MQLYGILLPGMYELNRMVYNCHLLLRSTLWLHCAFPAMLIFTNWLLFDCLLNRKMYIDEVDKC